MTASSYGTGSDITREHQLNMNAELIHMGLPQGDRLKRINAIPIRHMQTLSSTAKPQLEQE